MLLPILNINVRDTANQKLKLAFIKNIDEFGWNQLVEAGDKCLELFLDTFLNTPLGNEARLH